MDAMIVNKHTLHLEICLFAILLVFELDECVLQAVSCSLVSNDFTGQNLPKTAEDQLEIFIMRDRVELAYEQDVFGRLHLSKW